MFAAAAAKAAAINFLCYKHTKFVRANIITRKRPAFSDVALYTRSVSSGVLKLGLSYQDRKHFFLVSPCPCSKIFSFEYVETCNLGQWLWACIISGQFFDLGLVRYADMIHVISSSGDWEIVKDETDGFIYKRKKRKEPCPIVLETPTSRSHDATKAVARKRAFLRRKKERLLAMKQMYISELAEWEDLLNKQLALSKVAAPTAEALSEELACVPPDESLFEPYKKLLHQVTGLELFIQQHEEFCDQVDKLCKEDYLSLLYNKDLLQTLQSPGQIFGNLCTDSV